MKMRGIVAVVLGLGWLSGAPGVEPLAGKRIVFLGDSITQSGQYVGFTAYYLERMFPQVTFDIYSLGLSSETLSGLSEEGHANGAFSRPCLSERLDRLLERVRPEVVFACYGINDGIYQPLDEARFAAFRGGVSNLIGRGQAAGVKSIILVTPPIYDATTKPGEFNYDSVMTAYAAWEMSLHMPGVKVIDLHTAMRKARDARAEVFSKDRVHPGEEGHLFMARTILAGLGVKSPDEPVDTVKADPLYALVEQKRKLRSTGWMKHIGYTREKTVAPQPLGTTEAEAAEIQGKIDALPRSAGAPATAPTASDPTGAADWTPLFNGRDLTGWSVKCLAADRDKVFWRVEEAAIHCDSMGRKDHNYVWLLSDEEFADFELRLKFQAHADSPGNSGLQFRSRYEERADGGWLNGPQVDIHPPRAMSWRTGLIYDETQGERRWVYPSLPDSSMPPEFKPAQHVFRYADEGWNELELICRGGRVTTRVNGIVRTDWQGAGVLDNAAHRQHNVGRAGHFALQLHSRDELKIRYKDIEVKRLPTLETPTIPKVGAAMRDFVARREVAGAVTLVATPDDVLHVDAAGQADLAAVKPMAPDSIFWIASMTKPVTAVAVLMLQDEGKLSVDDPVGKYLPELGDFKTPDGRSAAITLRHLLTHTSGMPEATREQYRTARTLAEVIPFYAGKPLAFAPGEKWQYCQSGINTLGRIVEIVSGQSFPDFLQQRIFVPLGMKDTGFYLTEGQLPRLAKAYARTEDKLAEVPVAFLNGLAPTFRDRYPAPNGGLFSTGPDYARFCRMLLNRGSLDGRQLLKPETVDQMASIHTGDLKAGFTEGNGWGLGVCVVREPQGVTASVSPGSFGHGGAYGTQAWLDPVRKVAYVLMIQRSNLPNSDASDIRRAFQEAARGP